MNPTETMPETAVELSEEEKRFQRLHKRVLETQTDPDLDALLEFTDLLPDSDGEPLDNPWHWHAIHLLLQIFNYRWEKRDDFFVGGNMFVYYSLEHARKPLFRGPDFFYAREVDRHKPRTKWVWWSEGRLPDLIIEFLSHSTAKIDRGVKKDLYEKTFKTHEYFCYDPETFKLEGWRLARDVPYQPIETNERGWMWSKELNAWLGTWVGVYDGEEATWLRAYDEQGSLLLLREEDKTVLAEQQRQRADNEKQRADNAEAELAKLKARLEQLERAQGSGT